MRALRFDFYEIVKFAMMVLLLACLISIKNNTSNKNGITVTDKTGNSGDMRTYQLKLEDNQNQEPVAKNYRETYHYEETNTIGKDFYTATPLQMVRNWAMVRLLTAKDYNISNPDFTHFHAYFDDDGKFHFNTFDYAKFTVNIYPTTMVMYEDNPDRIKFYDTKSGHLSDEIYQYNVLPGGTDEHYPIWKNNQILSSAAKIFKYYYMYQRRHEFALGTDFDIRVPCDGAPGGSFIIHHYADKGKDE